MAWKTVTVDYGKTSYEAMMRGNEIAVNPSIGKPKAIKAGGESLEVLSSELDPRGELLVLTVDGEIAPDGADYEEQSDDEPDEGGDDD